MSKKTKRTILFVVCSAFALVFLMVFRFFLSALGVITGPIRDFAVDDAENVYVGLTDKICIIGKNEQRSEMHLSLSNNYALLIDNDKLFIGSSDGRGDWTIHLDNNTIEFGGIQYRDIISRVKQRSLIVVDGNTYEYRDHFGFSAGKILCNGKQIYSLSFFDYFMTGFPYSCLLVLSCFAIIVSLLLFIADPEAVKTQQWPNIA